METLLKAAPFELKEISESTGEFMGLASVYGNVDLGGDVIERGAFTRTLEEMGANRTLKYMHREAIGAAELSDSDEGLLAKGFLNLEVARAREVYSQLKFWKGHNMRAGMSIGYDTKAAAREGDLRLLKDIDLYEVSVTEPGMQMNPAAEITRLKALAAGIKSQRDFEEFLRDSGFSRHEAVALASRGWKGPQRDAEAFESQLSALFDLLKGERS